MKRRFFLMLAPLLLLLFAIPAHAYGPYEADQVNTHEIGIPLSVRVDGKNVATDVAPYLSHNRTFLPLRAAAESMGATVDWNASTRTAIVTKADTRIECTIGNKNFVINGISQHNDVAPEITQNRTMLPIRAIVEALNGSIQWDGSTASVNIYTGAPVAILPNDIYDSHIPSEVLWLIEKYYVHDAQEDTGTWGTLEQNPYDGMLHGHYLMTDKMADGTPVATKIDFIYDPVNYSMYSIYVETCPIRAQTRGFYVQDNLNYSYWYGEALPTSMSGYILESYICGDSYPQILTLNTITPYYNDPSRFPEIHGIPSVCDTQLLSLNHFPKM